MFAHGKKRKVILENRIYEGYFYVVKKSVGDTLYLQCKQRKTLHCGASAKIVAGQFVLEHVHSHPVDNRIISKKRFNDELYAAVTSSLRSFRSIYDELSSRDPDGAAAVPFVSAQQSMLRWRNLICPPIPDTLAHYTELLGMERWQTLSNYHGGRLNITLVTSEDGSNSIVFGDVEFLRRIESTRIYVDATFAVCPRKPQVRQLLTIMAQVDDTTLPIGWALMERKTYGAYVSVLQHFASVLAPHIRPNWFMTDFEVALAAALHTVYPEATAQRCYFHYCQALMKRAKKERVFQSIRNNVDMQIVFRKLMALALLPADDIVTAFHWIVTNTPLDIATHLTHLFQYIDAYWINTVTPHVFSVFGMECKTNNAIESYHRVLRIQIGVHPSIWLFTENLCRLQAVVRNSLTSLESGLSISRPSSERNVVQQSILQRAWDYYLQHTLDIPRFLACASSFLRAFNGRNIMHEANDVHHFTNPIVNEVNQNRAQVLLEENLDHICVLRRELEGGGEEIIILPELSFQRCVLCRLNEMDTISLPCSHWIACVKCATNLMQLAAAENADIRCSLCATIVKGFHQIIIAQQ